MMSELKLFPQSRGRFRFPLSNLTEYRTQLMGICAIGVILCHAVMPVNGVVLPWLVELFFSLGNQGVDVFFFLSGIGMYYSLQKNISLKEWYVKRLSAIGISYLILAIPFYGWYVTHAGGNILDFLCHLSLIGFWLENFGAWYIAVLLPLYMITPFMGKCIDKSKNRALTTCVFLFGVFFLCWIGRALTTGLWQNLFVRFLRSVPYFLGYGLGKAVREKRNVTWWIFPIFAALFLALTLLPDRISFAYNVLFIPIVMVLCVIARFTFAHVLWLDKVFCWCGKRSLELYLTNIFLPFMLRDIPIWDAVWNKGNYVFYAIVIVLGVAVSQAVYLAKKAILLRFFTRDTV